MYTKNVNSPVSSIANRAVAKKDVSQYEESDKTIQELYALGANADISEHKGKLAKGSTYLILGDKVNEEIKMKRDPFGNPVKIGQFTYSDIKNETTPFEDGSLQSKSNSHGERFENGKDTDLVNISDMDSEINNDSILHDPNTPYTPAQNIANKFNNLPPNTVPPATTAPGSKRSKGVHGTYTDRIKYIATDKDMKENLLHNPVQFAKDAPKYFHELVRDPLRAVKLMEDDLVTDDQSKPTQSLVKVNAQANAYIKEFLDTHETAIIEAVANIYKATKATQEEVGDYLYAKAGLERTDNQGKPAFSEDMNDPYNRNLVEQTIREFEQKVSPNLVDELWNTIKAATNYTLETNVRAGRISTDLAAELKARKYYVPLKGWADDIDDFYDYKSKSYSGSATLHKAVKRTSKPEGSPLEQIIVDAQNAIKYGQRNLAYQHVLNLARNNPDKTNILNLQQTWIVKVGGIWSETTEKPDAMMFLQTKQAIQQIGGLKLAKLSVSKKLAKAQGNGSTQAQIDTIQQQIDDISDAIAIAAEDIVVKTVWDNSNYDHRTDAQAKEHEVRVWDNGESFIVHMADPNVASAIQGNNILKAGDGIGGKMWGTLANLTRAWQQNVTGKSINFFVPNTIRDIQAAAQRHALTPRGNVKLFTKHYPTAQGMTHRYIRGTANPVYNPKGDPKSSQYDPKSMTRKEKQDYWDWFMDTMVKSGARSGYVHMQDLETTRKQIKKAIKVASKGRNPVEFIKYFAWHKPGALLEYGGIMSEDPTRIATAIATHLQGYSDELASTDAKEITVNFDRQSRIKTLMGPLFSFFQARVEGTANHLSQWKHNPKGAMKAAALWIGAGALLTEALRSLMDDEEEKQFNNLQPYVRYGYYVIPKSAFGLDSGLIKIPLPHGFGAYFAMGRIIDDVVRGFVSPEEGVKNVLSSTYNAFTPANIDGNDLSRSFVPPLFVPIYNADNEVNKDFAGRTISRPYATEKEKDYTPKTNMGLRDVAKPILMMTQAMNDAAGGNWKFGLAPQYEVDEQGRVAKKTGVSLMVANALDWNPSKLEHAFTYWAGGRGELYTQTAKLASALIKGDEVRPSYIPVYSRFAMSKGSGDVQADYYTTKKQLEMQVKQRSIAKKNDNQDMRSAQREDSQMSKTLHKFRLTETRINGFNEKINAENATEVTKAKYQAKRTEAITNFMEYYNKNMK
jgi:hypothetical protein